MLVNVLNICSDDELMSDGDDALEEGNVHYLALILSILIRIILQIFRTKSALVGTGRSYIVIRDLFFWTLLFRCYP